MIGKFLYVITGSHYDFASHVASYAIGEDWKDLFDIVIFFARKPSFFLEKRPFWRLDGPVEVMIISWEFSDTPLTLTMFHIVFLCDILFSIEVESFQGWEDLETGECYSQGNW